MLFMSVCGQLPPARAERQTGDPGRIASDDHPARGQPGTLRDDSTAAGVHQQDLALGPDRQQRPVGRVGEAHHRRAEAQRMEHAPVDRAHEAQRPGAGPFGDLAAVGAEGRGQSCIQAAGCPEREPWGTPSRSGDASSAARSANSDWGVTLSRTARMPRISEISGSLGSWAWLSADSAWAWAPTCSETACDREIRAKMSSPTEIAATTRLAPTSSRWRRATASRLASTYSRCSGVGAGSAPSGLAASHPSADFSSDPRSRKLRSRPSASHSSALTSQRVCAFAASRSVSSADTSRPTRGVEVVAVGERDPVAVADLLRQLAVGDGVTQHRHDPLLQLARVLDLVLAVGRRDGRRRDDEQERVGLLDRPLDRLREHLAVGDPLRVQPDLLAVLGHRVGQPAHELRVPAGVGNEDVSHRPVLG